MNYSDNQLTALAQKNPKELARILSSPNADIRMLTYGAEILGGEVNDEEVVLPVLKLLLKHMNAIVREGALLGVSSFFINKKPPADILEKLKAMSIGDPSPTIKDTAKGLLKDFE
jgi:vesicle coat complex subunit